MGSESLGEAVELGVSHPPPARSLRIVRSALTIFHWKIVRARLTPRDIFAKMKKF